MSPAILTYPHQCMPLYHSAASVLGWANVVSFGGTFAIGNKFSTKTFWKEVRQHNATIIQYVGETCRYLLAAPPEIDPVTGENLDKKHNVRTAMGNGLRPDVWNRFKERFGIPNIAEFYAATEGSLGLWNFSRNEMSMGAVGRQGWLYRMLIGRNTALAIVDAESGELYRDPKTGLCRKAKANEAGELVFKLPPEDPQKMFQGYYNNKSAS